MVKFGGEGIKWQNIFILLFFVAIILYLIGQFTSTTPSGIEFKIPANIDQTVFAVFKFALIGALVFGVWALFMKISGGSLSQRDVLTIALIVIAVIIAWDPIIKNLLGGQTLNDITFSVGQKLGFFKP